MNETHNNDRILVNGGSDSRRYGDKGSEKRINHRVFSVNYFYTIDLSIFGKGGESMSRESVILREVSTFPQTIGNLFIRTLCNLFCSRYSRRQYKI